MGRRGRMLGVRLARVAAAGAVVALLYNKYELYSCGSVVTPSSASDVFATSRQRTMRKLQCSEESVYDLCVIGGDMTGLYVAVDAAQRGLRVALVERGDFGGSWRDASEIGFLHGGFAHMQRAIRQRDLLHGLEAYRAMRDITVWERVARGCVARTKTLLPITHRIESNEMTISAALCCFMSSFAGPFQSCWGGPTLWKGPSSAGETSIATDPSPHSTTLVSADAAIDYHRAAIALARTSCALGCDILNYASVASITAAAAAPTTAETSESTGNGPSPSSVEYIVKVKDLNRVAEDPGGASQALLAIRAKSIVNAAGPDVDGVRHQIVEAVNNYRHASSAFNSGREFRNSSLPRIVDRVLGHAFFVVPRDSLVSAVRGEPVLGNPTEESVSSDQQPLPAAGGAPLTAVVASSSLRAFSNVNIIPIAGKDALLIGSAIVAPEEGGSEAAAAAFDASAGRTFSFHEQKSMLLRVRSQLRLLGLDITHAASLVCIAYPLLSLPSKLGLETSNDLQTQGYAVLPREQLANTEAPKPSHNASSDALPLDASLTETQSPNAFHIIGAAAHNSRRVAEDVVNRVQRCLGLSAPMLPKRCQTERLQLLVLDLDHVGSAPLRETLRRLVDESFVMTVTDVIARRSKAAWLDPQQCKNVVIPAVAREMQLLFGWSERRTSDEIAAAESFVRSCTLAF